MSRRIAAVIGASSDRSKFGNKALRAFRNAGYEVYAINPNTPEVEGLPTYPNLDALPVDRLDLVSFYVPPEVGIDLLDQVARKQVGEVWINPGADSPEVMLRGRELGLNLIQACSILGAGESPGAY